MHLWVGVKNFAKIESARICTDGFTLLAGQNNSGKTFLMQLVQGVSERLTELVDEDIASEFRAHREDGYDKYVISGENIQQFVNLINQRLHEEKESIVREIFGKAIPVEELYIDILWEKNCRYEIFISKLGQGEDIDRHIEEISGYKTDFFSAIQLPYPGFICVLLRTDLMEEQWEYFRFGCSEFTSRFKISMLRNVLGYMIGYKSLFLPASRTGLLLLYRDFFLNKTDDAVTYKIEDGKAIENIRKYGELTQPIYEFLRFLQSYSEDEDLKEKYKKELQFFDDQLIEGHIDTDSNGRSVYHPKTERNKIPMYLASSMINEIAPLSMAVVDKNGYERLIIDEIEASLHPEKQLKLVRFLNRIYNRGTKLIISTHSDTFASKVNNLYLISRYVKQKQKYDILEEFGLEEDDLIDPGQLFVYEFVIQPGGKSIVKEIEGNEKTGFQFDLFTDSAMQLYEEAIRLGRYDN